MMKQNKKLQIVFISSLQYPEGGAPANRHLAYAKGLCELGNEISFVLTSIQSDKNKIHLIQNINFVYIEHVKNFKKQNENFAIRLFLKYKSYIKCKEYLIALKKKKSIDILVLLDSTTIELFPILRVANRLRICVIHERTEYPFIFGHDNFIGKLNLWLYYKIVLPRFNGLFVISEALKKHFFQEAKFQKPIAIINMIVDPSRFEFKSGTINSEYSYIAYCGSMEGDKDGIGTLIRAFGKAINTSSFCADLRLKLIGDISNDKLVQNLKQIALDSNCLDQIILTGKVQRSYIPELLSNSKALVLARPANKQAEGGFPTKLGEYLATGKPVIITRVGEIENFLINGVNSFLAQPNDVSSFSNQIIKVFSDYSNAIEIGGEGRKLTYTVFNYKTQAIVLHNFMIQILDS